MTTAVAAATMQAAQATAAGAGLTRQTGECLVEPTVQVIQNGASACLPDLASQTSRFAAYRISRVH